MTLIARIEGGAVAEYRDDIDLASIPEHKRQHFLPVVDTRPAYDPDYQHLTGPVETVLPDRVQRVWSVEAKAITTQMVDAEWSRRVFAGFAFGGKAFKSDRDSIDNITGAVLWARQAMSEGVNAGNLHWDAPDPNSPPAGKPAFAWKATDGTYLQMDAPTVSAFGIALARHKQSHFLAAQTLKAMDPIPTDYKDDVYWP